MASEPLTNSFAPRLSRNSRITLFGLETDKVTQVILSQRSNAAMQLRLIFASADTAMLFVATILSSRLTGCLTFDPQTHSVIYQPNLTRHENRQRLHHLLEIAYQLTDSKRVMRTMDDLEQQSSQFEHRLTLG